MAGYSLFLNLLFNIMSQSRCFHVRNLLWLDNYSIHDSLNGKTMVDNYRNISYTFSFFSR